MNSNSVDITRRNFLLKSAALGIGVMNLTAPRAGIAASRDRIIVFQGVGLDSLHPYAYSGGGISGIWQHVIEPLIEMDFPRGICRRPRRIVAISRPEVDIPLEKERSFPRRLGADVQGCSIFDRSHDA